MSDLISEILMIPRLLSEVWLAAIQNFPGPLGFKFRHRYWRKRLKFLGNSTKIDVGVYFENPEFISIADNCWVDRGVVMLAGIDNSRRQKRLLQSKAIALHGEVVIGRNVHIGPYSILSGIDGGLFIGKDCTLSAGVKVFSFTHHFRFHDAPENTSCSFGSMVEQSRQCLISGPIVLEDNVGVALSSTILPGVFVGRNSFIKANSFVYNQEFAGNSLISGNPAKCVGKRFRAKENIEARP